MIGKTIAIDNTRFIYQTQFSGDPTKDRFGDSRRKCNILIPDMEQVRDLIKAGFTVRETKPRQDEDPADFQPEYFVTAILKYRNRNGMPVKYPPKVYLVNENDEPVLQSEDTIALLDDMRIRNVNVILNPYEYDPANHGMSLYIRTMYVEQDMDDDPYAALYRRRREEVDESEEEPF